MTKEQPYSNREIKSMIDGIIERLDAHTEVHSQILTQVTNTNGKVAEIQKWRERMVGAMWAGSILFTLVIFPLVTWMVVEISTLNEKIAAALEDYEVQVISE